MEGGSLLPVLDGGTLGERLLFWEHEGNRAVRAGRWKVTARGAKGPWELYDLEADRTETRNLAGEHPARVKALAAEWNAWAERTGALPWPWE